MLRHLLVLACSLSLATAAFAMACSGGNDGGNATATSTTEATATAPPTPVPETPTPAPDIRLQDLTQQAGVRDFLTASGGEATAESILYADVTDDGVEEAILPIGSGGESGNIALLVYGYQPSGLTELLRVVPEIRLQAVVDAGQLIVTEPVFGPNDPIRFPSQLRVTTYEWDGSALAIVDQVTTSSGEDQKP